MKFVDLPVTPAVEPMLAKAQGAVPAEPGLWSYEPKWDGFRALVFRNGDDVVVPRAIGGRARLDWDSLSQRIHPAASRRWSVAQHHSPPRSG
jgi:hypothetical protein